MEESNIVDTNANNELINSIRKSIENETNSLAFYNMLLNQITDEEDINILTNIMENESRHCDILKEIYFGITNTNLDNKRSIFVENRSIIDNYEESLKNGLFDEIDSVKNYRHIQNYMPDTQKYNMINEVITNKLCNINMYNYLISKNIHR